MKKNIFFTALGILITQLGFAQNELDALRYSQLSYGGTARYVGLGGAMGALGADVSVLSTNPAGMGLFNKSEFSISPSISFFSGESSLTGLQTSENKAFLSLPSIGFVAIMDHEISPNWKNFQIGFAYNKLADFHTKYSVTAENSGSSLLDVFTNFANGIPEALISESPNEYDLDPAYWSYLIDPDSLSSLANQWTHPLMGISNITQVKEISTKGRVGEYSFGFGGNYSDEFYFGFGMGITSSRDISESIHSEFSNDTTSTLANFSFAENLSIRGTGVNLKAGIIYRPIQILRFGLSAQTPSWTSFTEEYSTVTESLFRDDSSYINLSPAGYYQYKITTPARITGSAAVVIGKRWLLSGEAELVDYSGANIGSRFDNASYSYENEAIKNIFNRVINLKFGTEFKFNHYYLRGGFSHYPSPYNSEFAVTKGNRMIYSGGVGYRTAEFFIDIAYSYNQWKGDLYLYDPELIEPSTISNTLQNFIVTAGVRI